MVKYWKISKQKIIALCDKLSELKFLLHGIFEGHYLNVNKDFGGFGGVCLPKDTKAMSYLVEKLGLDLQLFKMIIVCKTIFNLK